MKKRSLTQSFFFEKLHSTEKTRDSTFAGLKVFSNGRFEPTYAQWNSLKNSRSVGQVAHELHMIQLYHIALNVGRLISQSPILLFLLPLVYLEPQ